MKRSLPYISCFYETNGDGDEQSMAMSLFSIFHASSTKEQEHVYSNVFIRLDVYSLQIEVYSLVIKCVFKCIHMYIHY